MDSHNLTGHKEIATIEDLVEPPRVRCNHLGMREWYLTRESPATGNATAEGQRRWPTGPASTGGRKGSSGQ
jgi:hypothetical protein